MKFVDIFSGLGAFHRALRDVGHECVFASESDRVLRDVYVRNFPDSKDVVFGDIREVKHLIPAHDILCAGFPCQPFSKSGDQKGFSDATRGTLFHEVLEIVEARLPNLVLLENVGNFARHDGGRTWEIVRGSLQNLGYDVRGTEPRVMGGHGLISPHHFGHPQHRERFFVVAALWDLPDDPFPAKADDPAPNLEDILFDDSDLTDREHKETALSRQQIEAIDHWNVFLNSLPPDVKLPSTPIWADEFGAAYEFECVAPLTQDPRVLAKQLGLRRNGRAIDRSILKQTLPSYARQSAGQFPLWKQQFIRQNRQFYHRVQQYLPSSWLAKLSRFPASLRKLEWNCQGEKRDLWSCVLQFRPSGIRAKRYTALPALVAMTTTQIPILGPRRRYISRREALRSFGFPDSAILPDGHGRAFQALGNTVHVDVVQRILASAWMSAEGVFSDTN
jgi:DNA (cytosine-5)-methyltransferase 1